LNTAAEIARFLLIVVCLMLMVVYFHVWINILALLPIPLKTVVWLADDEYFFLFVHY
jgi:hypothetical protein